MTQLTDHFSVEELACRCGCGFGTRVEDYEPGFLEFLELVRVIFGRPIHPTSGARCTDHNRAVGGVNLSAHTRAAALDATASNGYERHGLLVAYVLALAVRRGRLDLDDAIELASELIAHGGGFGLAKTFAHLDVDVHLPRPSSWGYPPNTTNTL